MSEVLGIGNLRRRFLYYSGMGFGVLCLLSILVLSMHEVQLRRQLFFQEFNSLLREELRQLRKVSYIRNGKRIESFDERIEDIRSLKSSIDRRLYDKDTFLELNSKIISDVTELHEVVEKQLWTISNSPSDSNAISSNLRIIEMKLDKLLTKLKAKRGAGSRQIKYFGWAIIVGSLLGVSLLWFSVFRPLFNTVFEQNEKIRSYVDELEETSNYKENFLMSISHEIRTPMTAILGYTELLKKKEIDESKVQDTIGIIDKNAKHLLKLIDEILDISKVDSDQFSLEINQLNLHQLVRDSLNLVPTHQRSKDVELKVVQKGPIPFTISSDKFRLKQVLLNILGNAIKFTEKGIVSLEIESNEGLTTILVKDDGPGIPEDKWEVIFAPFEQADNTITRKFQGTGLGLVLARELSRRLGGDVQIVESVIGKGSTFKITFKDFDYAKNSDQGEGQIDLDNEEKKSRASININELSDKKILIVDDAKENTRLFSLYLKSTKANISTANSGREALELASRVDFDAILLDLQMPEMDGFEVIKKLKELKSSPPILALTAHGMESEKVKTKSAGFYSHIVKPVGSSELIKSLKEAISA